MRKKDCKVANTEKELSFAEQARIVIKEREEAESYVMTKPMQRPRANIFSVLLILFIYGAVCFGVAFAIAKLADTKEWSPLVYITTYVIGFCCIARLLCIKLVDCYQHYAKEETRRKCLCKPTCSEYAISVLKKHCLIVALNKIRIRLFITCKGDYKIDLPK